MDIISLNKNFDPVSIIEQYSSAIWTDRFSRCGDFEIMAPASEYSVASIPNGSYLSLANSDHIMIVEKIEFKTDITDTIAHTVIVSGRSIESILDRRVILDFTIIDGSLQDGIEKILSDAFINPKDPKRKIDNFVFKKSSDPRITSLNLTAQCYGDCVYDWIVDVCEAYGIGFKISLSNKKLEFSLLVGEDRSSSQTKNPYVKFSRDLDNLINSDYYISTDSYKNIAIVESVDSNENLHQVIVGDADGSQGLDRREIYVDGSYVSDLDEQGTPLPQSTFTEELNQIGKESLIENSVSELFDASVQSMGMFKYKQDFEIGDIVEIQNEYGFSAIAKITEMIFSQNESGYETFPTFMTI